MENISEKHAAKRGRPPAFTAKFYEFMPGILGCHDQTRRSQQNHLWSMQAIGAFMDRTNGIPKKYAWIVKNTRRKRDSKLVILAAIGRLPTKAIMRLVATKICKEKLRTREAVELIRRVRIACSESE